MLRLLAGAVWVTLALCDCHNNIIAGSIQMGGVGPSTAYVAVDGGNTGQVSVAGNSVTLDHNCRAYIVKSCATSFQPDMFREVNLLGHTVSWTADLSRLGCGCNGGIYMVHMPGYDSNNQPDPAKGKDYYCDANDVGGNWCPEMDLMESNSYGMSITPHKCDKPNGKYYSACDRSGCGISVYKSNPKNFGPGSNFTIDTERPFRTSIKFVASGTTLTSLETTLDQGGRTVKFTHNDGRCGSGYMDALSESFQQMVFTFTNWGSVGSKMGWLDVPPCAPNSNCNDGRVTISDISVE